MPFYLDNIKLAQLYGSELLKELQCLGRKVANINHVDV